MINVNKKNKVKNKVFEFLTIFSMVFGLVIGNGIYLKNSNEPGGVLGEAGQNPYIAIFVWVFIGVMCTLMMITFIEASSAAEGNEDHSTVQSWAKKFINNRCASLFSILYICMYMPVLLSLASLFSIEIIFESVDDFFSISSKWGLVKFTVTKIILSMLLLIFFQLLNIYTYTPSKFIQTFLTFVKFIPLFVAIVGSFSVFAIDGPNKNNSFNPVEKHYSSWKPTTLLATSMPVLFAFDGFVYAATLRKDCENKKVVAPAMLSAILAVTVFYIVVTVSIFISREDGNIFNLFDEIFRGNIYFVLLFKIIIAITMLTILNGYSTLMPRTINSAIDEKLIAINFKSNAFKKGGYLGFTITSIIFVVFVSSSLALTGNRESELSAFYISNYSSNSTVIFAFTSYLLVMIFVLINKKTKKVRVDSIRGSFIIGIISSVMLFIVLGYAYYDFLINKFINKSYEDPALLILFSLLIGLIWFINEIILSKNNIEENDFYLRLNPKNWHKYNKQIALTNYVKKKGKKNEIRNIKKSL
ncbi:amino acid permease [Spiroplasma corruscae]|uniref:Amino acid permease n=1 Tax=Spiroplasma corruscae TaxID=216934 RepID=A0A222EQH1_9MOLU|nr:amino acid permease [Spiroplasma corruscae]ASP28752.1 amino acid permease [Spiroplasma corruscae]